VSDLKAREGCSSKPTNLLGLKTAPVDEKAQIGSRNGGNGEVVDENKVVNAMKPA